MAQKQQKKLIQERIKKFKKIVYKRKQMSPKSYTKARAKEIKIKP